MPLKYALGWQVEHLKGPSPTQARQVKEHATQLEESGVGKAPAEHSQVVGEVCPESDLNCKE